jgi:ribosomal protein L20
MIRIKKSSIGRKNKKKLFKNCSTNRGSSAKLYRKAKEQLVQNKQNSYIGKRLKERQKRISNIIQLSNLCYNNNRSYSEFKKILKKNKILLNNKMTYFFFKENKNLFKIIC